MKKFIIERNQLGLKSKGNLQSLINLSAFHFTIGGPIVMSLLILILYAQSIFTVGQVLC